MMKDGSGLEGSGCVSQDGEKIGMALVRVRNMTK